jgi:hypothetical protein
VGFWGSNPPPKFIHFPHQSAAKPPTGAEKRFLDGLRLPNLLF